MAKTRKIQRFPTDNLRQYYLVDANFLARKYVLIKYLTQPHDLQRVLACRAWWKEIDRQIKSECARVYTPDICIAEAFKVFASWYYVEKWFPNASAYKNARDKLSRDVRTDTKALQTTFRPVAFHDISTNRDIIISVDRFFEVVFKHARGCSVPDIILAATAKYLREFYDIPKDRLHVVTMDRSLRRAISRIQELPKAYDPALPAHAASKIFE